MQNFFWPGMYIVVSRYCKPCSICQKGTQKGKKDKSKFWTLMFHFQFSDRFCFTFTNEGQVKQVHSGMDYETRFLEAFPMINQRVGVSKEILSDQGAYVCPYTRVLQNA